MKTSFLQELYKQVRGCDVCNSSAESGGGGCAVCDVCNAQDSPTCTTCDVCNASDAPCGQSSGGCTLYCNICNTCNGTPTGCNVNQNLCTINCQFAKQYIGSANAPLPAKDQIIIKVFPLGKLNSLIAWINKASLIGNSVHSPTSNISKESRPFIYAEKINEVIANMYNISHHNSFRTFNRDDIIYADEFKSLMQKINNLYINMRACHNCNTTCDATCNSCNQCNTCQSCNLCQGGNRCSCGRRNSPTCETCNSCEGCNTCEGCLACQSCNTCQNCNSTELY